MCRYFTVRVGIVKWMSIFAGRFLGARRADAITSQDIIALRHGFKVAWVDAVPYAAQVINGEAVRDRTYQGFVRPPMCQEFLSACNRKGSVAVIHAVGRPVPATIQLRSNVVPEAIFNGLRCWNAAVVGTEALCICRAEACSETPPTLIANPLSPLNRHAVYYPPVGHV